MITTLLLLALPLTLLLALTLPFGGWPSGADAAGRGMAMIVPFGCILIQGAILIVAAMIATSRGALDWSYLPRGIAWLPALALVGGGMLLAFNAAEKLGRAPTTFGHGTFAFLAIMVTPLVLILWLFAETYGVHPAQAYVVRALAVLVVLGPVPLLRWIDRREALARAADEAAEVSETERSRKLASILPRDATLLEALRFHDRLTDEDRQAKAFILADAQARPNGAAEFLALLDNPDWNARITAGLHAEKFVHQPGADYYAQVKPIVTEIVRRLHENVTDPESAHREALAAIRLSWPAINRDHLPRALMAELYAAIQAKPAGDPIRVLDDNAGLLAEMVEG